MKYFISNRGNINGRKESKENSPKYVLSAIKNGFHCVVDVIYVEDVLYFGNSKHLYIIDLDFIITNNEYLWLRCFDYATVNYLLQIKNVKLLLVADGEPISLTSNKKIWLTSYDRRPGEGGQNKINSQTCVKRTITYMPENSNWTTYPDALGVCSNYIKYIHEFYNSK
jgi:hypothetical protein